jgi:hypothetical protein
MVGVYTGVVTAPAAMVRAMLGVDAHARIRRAHVLVISIAFGIIAARLLGVHPVPASTAGQLAFWALPAVTVAVVIGAVLVIASGSSRSLALLAVFGLPDISSRHRARANGLVWSGIALLMVHFTAPAFEFVPGGPIVVGIVFAAGLGYGTMRLHLAAIDHEAYRSFNLVAMLLAAGSLASMSITPTGEWWTHNFSTLGTSDDLAAACFNIAVTMAGLGMALLGPALSGALRVPGFGLRRGGLMTIRVLIAFIGVSLMGVGLVPIDGATVLHNVFASGAAAGFALLSLGVQLWARRMPRGLVVFSYAALAVEIAAMIAYDGLKLFNLTVFEIVAFTLVFAWLIALVATTATVGAAAEAEPVAETSSTAELTVPVAERSAVVPSMAADVRHLAPRRAARRTGGRLPARPGTRRRASASSASRARVRTAHDVDRARGATLLADPGRAGRTVES